MNNTDIQVGMTTNKWWVMVNVSGRLAKNQQKEFMLHSHTQSTLCSPPTNNF